MRTQEQIVEKLRTSESFFGFDADVLLPYLEFARAKEFLKPDVDEQAWHHLPLERGAVVGDLTGYLEFAIGKALDHRGISAGRSVEKLTAWVWLLDDAPLAAAYPQYGAPILKQAAERYWPGVLPKHEVYDAGGKKRRHKRGQFYPGCGRCLFDRMAAGLPCIEGCRDGCGE